MKVLFRLGMRSGTIELEKDLDATIEFYVGNYKDKIKRFSVAPEDSNGASGIYYDIKDNLNKPLRDFYKLNSYNEKQDCNSELGLFFFNY